MRWMDKFRLRLRSIFLKRAVDDELDKELQFHLDQQIAENIELGMTPEDARYAALRSISGMDQRKEECRDVRAVNPLMNALQNIRIGSRMLLKSPMFTIFATLALSIGIGANVTIFSYVNAILFRSLSVPEPSRLMRVYGSGRRDLPVGPVIGYTTYQGFRERNATFSNLGLLANGESATVRIGGRRNPPVDLVQYTYVTGSLFQAIGAPTLLGRTVEAPDELTGAPPVVVLNEQAHRQYFASDPDVVGRIIFVDNLPYTVVGVMPRAFDDVLSFLPSTRMTSPRLFIAFNAAGLGPRRSVFVIGRIRSDVTQAEAQADLERIALQLSGETKESVGVSVERADRLPSFMWILLATSAALFLLGFISVLLIACDDIAIMLLARVSARRREMGIRMALGAARSQLVSQLVVENLLLAVMGGVGAMMFSLFVARLIDTFGLPLPEASRLQFDWRVLAFTIGISLATTLFFGLRPALDCVKKDVIAALNPNHRSWNERPASIRSTLLITQITVCTALLITAAVIARSGLPHSLGNRGFRSDHVLLGTLYFDAKKYDNAAKTDFYRKLLERLAETPGVESANVMRSLPVQLPYSRYGGFMIPDTARSEPGREERVVTNIVSSGHFATLRIPLIGGRDFTAHDAKQAPAVSIVSQALAHALWTNASPIGQRLEMGDGSFSEVIGVVGDTMYQITKSTPSFIVYRPLGQAGAIPDAIMIRTTGVPTAVTALLRNRVGEIDPDLLVHNIRPMDDQIQQALLPFQILMLLVGAPGAFALLLGIIGTYGTMAILVNQRRREIGVRLALGGSPGGVRRMVMRDGLASTGIGLLLGCCGAIAIAFWMRYYIAGNLHFFDPFAFVAMMLVVLATAVIACYIPARRASRVDPMIVLREE